MLAYIHIYLWGLIIGFVVFNCLYRYRHQEKLSFEDSFFSRIDGCQMSGSDIDFFFMLILTWPLYLSFIGLMCIVIYGWERGIRPLLIKTGTLIQRLLVRLFYRTTTKD